MNPEEEYSKIGEGTLASDLPEKSNLGKLFGKMKEREKKFHRQQQAVQEAMVDPEQIAAQMESLTGVKDLQQYNSTIKKDEEAKASVRASQENEPDAEAQPTGGNAFGQ